MGSTKKKKCSKKSGNRKYISIKQILDPIFNAYKDKNATDINWTKMYKQAWSLEKKTYDQELNLDDNNVSFRIYFLLQVLLIKHQSHLLDPQTKGSEWDFIVKFWGLMTEILFYGI